MNVRKYRKSSYSGVNGGNCVEWATDHAGVHLRDSKNPSGPELLVDRAAWAQFVAAVGQDRPHPWVALAGDGAVVRTDPTGPALRFTTAEWDAFAAGARDGEPLAV